MGLTTTSATSPHAGTDASSRARCDNKRRPHLVDDLLPDIVIRERFALRGLFLAKLSFFLHVIDDFFFCYNAGANYPELIVWFNHVAFNYKLGLHLFTQSK